MAVCLAFLGLRVLCMFRFMEYPRCRKNWEERILHTKTFFFLFSENEFGDVHCHVTGSHEEALYYRHQFHGVNLKCLNGRQKPVISFL